MDQIKSFLSGGAAGVATVLAGHPFDTLKVRLQTSNQYSGLLDCLRQTVRRDGLLGVYRGMASPLIGVTPMFALSFWSYDVGQQIVYRATPNRSARNLSMYEIAFAGGFSAIPTTIVTTPMERVKVVLQTQGQNAAPAATTTAAGAAAPAPKAASPGMVKTAMDIWRDGGMRSLYRGTVATLARDIPGSAAYFVAYEACYRKLKRPDADISVGAVLFSGGMAGVAMWVIAIPPDVIKSRIQFAPSGTYKGFIHCGAQIVKQEGPAALFKGLGPALLRAFPANAAGFLARAVSLEAMHRMW
ncbi:hypothetical protein CXG81DRAFT_9402 [Caulochytrium protostelioides]|uniref:Mitochondrial carrier n=1 Tax=Caulochytrium protostelioides TaxID=1555241 RepID=A0A4P9XDG8_9FUNG|nr:hypothetical protein CXG81DRAFT_9402 [Caulochytrium protostelioides]|eukprot:RKP03556.1 hypothetical protein CXG81DRAFT_9402 [Caulochytrium protostelioides]